jgi:hypothetical protein
MSGSAGALIGLLKSGFLDHQTAVANEMVAGQTHHDDDNDRRVGPDRRWPLAAVVNGGRTE